MITLYLILVLGWGLMLTGLCFLRGIRLPLSVLIVLATAWYAVCLCASRL